MTASVNTLSDQQRVNLLNAIYRQAVSTSTTDLGFSTEKLSYIRPFLGKLQQELKSSTPSLVNLMMVREVIDQLITDIKDELAVFAAGDSSHGLQQVLLEQGLMQHSSMTSQVA